MLKIFFGYVFSIDFTNNCFVKTGKYKTSQLRSPITTTYTSKKTHIAKQSTVAKGTCFNLKLLPLTTVTTTAITIIIVSNMAHRCDTASREIKHFIISQWHNKIGDSQQQRQQMDKVKDTETHTHIYIYIVGSIKNMSYAKQL